MDSATWYKHRRYLHFDTPVTVKKAVKIVTDPSAIKEHSFLPFLNYKIQSKKIFKDKTGIVTKKKDRPIAFSAHLDSHIYSYYCQQMSELYEKCIEGTSLESSVLAFRALGKSNIDFANDAFNAIRLKGECTAIGLDISGFFDNLDHKQLKECWKSLLAKDSLPPDHFAVFKSITRYSQVDRNKLYNRLDISLNNPPKAKRRICTIDEFRNIVRKEGFISSNSLGRGIPQGSPISAFLSNLYMIDFDKVVSAAVAEQGGIYYRYCDDMLVIVPTEWKSEIENFVRDEIKKLKIDINTDKTDIRDFRIVDGVLKSDKPLQYLGFLFDGTQILLRSSSLARYSERMRRGVSLAKRVKYKRDKFRVTKGGVPSPSVYKRNLYEKYSHLGRRNFVRYGFRAAGIMDSRAIKKQLKPLWKRLNEQIDK